MIDHDRLFKELLSTFFVEFLDLFLPDVAASIERDSVRFLPQEYFADLTTGEDKVVDLLVEVQQSGAEAAFLIHVAAQSSSEQAFAQRMFFYFARLHQKYLQRIYPIVVFSFDEPQRKEPCTYTVMFPHRKILEFNFEAIQLNRLHWRDYLNQQNPVAAALMAKMQIAVEDRPKVKVVCLRLIATLQLDPARTRLLSGFVDTYLRLDEPEVQLFQEELDRLEPAEQEVVMEIVTSWLEQGLERGLEQGLERERSLILRMLTRKVGLLPEAVRSRVEALTITPLEALGEALLDFSNLSDLETWLAENAGEEWV